MTKTPFSAADLATKTMNNPRYPLELFMCVVTVSIEAMKIFKDLPKLEILEGSQATAVVEVAA